MISLKFEQKRSIGLKYVLDLMQPVTPFGEGLLKKQHFYSNDEKDELTLELENVRLLCGTLDEERTALQNVIHAMSQLKDVRGSVKNVATGYLGEVELFQLNEFLLRFERLVPLVQNLGAYNELSGVRFSSMQPALAVLDPTGSGRLSFFIEDTRTPKLLDIRKEKRNLEERLRLSKDEAEKKRLMSWRMQISSTEDSELTKIHREMSLALRPYVEELTKNIDAIARLDFAIQKALLARRYGAVEPRIGGSMRIKNAFNPQISDYLQTQKRAFTPISMDMPSGVTVLTGANMGGKSVALKTVTLNICLAILGCFVFCEEAEIPLFDSVEIMSEDLSSAERGLSSFGGEIVRLNEIIAGLKKGAFSFIAMDEFARGTNNEEGAAIVRATVKYLNEKSTVALLATHYDGAAEYASKHYQVIGLKEFDYAGAARRLSSAVSDGVRLIAESMNYGLFEVTGDTPCPKDAVNICRLLGMEGEILGNITNDA